MDIQLNKIDSRIPDNIFANQIGQVFSVESDGTQRVIVPQFDSRQKDSFYNLGTGKICQSNLFFLLSGMEEQPEETLDGNDSSDQQQGIYREGEQNPMGEECTGS